jgi:hypothetical protein
MIAEALDRLARLRVEAEQAGPAGDEDAQFAAIAPRRDAAILEPARRSPQAERIPLGVEPPALGAGDRIERRDIAVRRADEQQPVDHQRRRLERGGRGALFRPWADRNAARSTPVSAGASVEASISPSVEDRVDPASAP